MTETIIIGFIALVVVILFFAFRKKGNLSQGKANIIRILSYLFLLLFLTTAIIVPQNKILVFSLLGGAILFFGLLQYKNMKQLGGNVFLWFLPVLLALLFVLVFITVKLIY
jgi:hypothetical protein